MRAVVYEQAGLWPETIDTKGTGVSADTPVLGADLIWRPVGDLLPGDELVGFDVEAPIGSGGRSGYASRGRVFRKATVTGNSLQQGALVRVVTPRGDVHCTADHPWLTRNPRPIKRRRTWDWVQTNQLRPGLEVLQLLELWEVDSSRGGGWLSGMFDGEGCLSFNGGGGGAARLHIVQRTSPTADKIYEELKLRLPNFSAKERYPANEAPPTAVGRRRENRKPVMTYSIDTRADVIKILGSIRPERLLVNADRVWVDRTISGKYRMTTVTSIEDSGPGKIAMLSTSTETYVAGGFAVHDARRM